MNYNNLINKYNLKINKVTIKKGLTILNTSLGLFVIKDNKDIQKYKYLLSRGFNYIPKIIDYDDEVIMFEYIENIKYDDEEKIFDYIKLLSLLHLKTSYYKETDENEYKVIYDQIYTRLSRLNEYYNSLIDKIESKEYMSPSEYLVARNYSIIKSSIIYCFNSLDSWYNNIDKTKKRVATIHNGTIEDILKDLNNTYITDFSKSYTDIPIFDLLNIYNRYYYKYDFSSLLKKYESIFKLSNEEKDLLYLYISIPDIIYIKNNILDIKLIKSSINKLYISLKILNSKEKESSNTHETKDN